MTNEGMDKYTLEKGKGTSLMQSEQKNFRGE